MYLLLKLLIFYILTCLCLQKRRMVGSAGLCCSVRACCFLRCDCTLSAGVLRKKGPSEREKLYSACGSLCCPFGCSWAEETGTHTIEWCGCQEAFYAHWAIGGVASVGFSQRDAQGTMSNCHLWDKTWERSVSSYEINSQPCLLQ